MRFSITPHSILRSIQVSSPSKPGIGHRTARKMPDRGAPTCPPRSHRCRWYSRAAQVRRTSVAPQRRSRARLLKSCCPLGAAPATAKPWVAAAASKPDRRVSHDRSSMIQNFSKRTRVEQHAAGIRTTPLEPVIGNGCAPRGSRTRRSHEGLPGPFRAGPRVLSSRRVGRASRAGERRAAGAAL